MNTNWSGADSDGMRVKLSTLWANIVAGAIAIAFVIGGGSTTLHYIFFATLEVVCALFIMVLAWRWPNPVRQVEFHENNFAA